MILLVAVALTALSIAGYFYFQNKQYKYVPSKKTPATTPNDETASWKTYKNEKYGFEVKYPPGWVAEGFEEQKLAPPLSKNSSSTFSFDFQNSKVQEKKKNLFDRENMFVGFQLVDPSPTLTIEDRSCSRKTMGRSCISRNLVIDGVEAISVTFLIEEGKNGESGEGLGNKERRIEFIKNNKLYEFYTGFDGLPQQNELTSLTKKEFYIDKIASSFRFIDFQPTPTCRPRPACLDATPHCLIPVTPDMCPAK